MDSRSLENVRAEALFVSDVQRSDQLSSDQLRAAVLHIVRRYGSRHLAALVAAEFGEHPDTAQGRMSWALGVIRQADPHEPQWAAA